MYMYINKYYKGISNGAELHTKSNLSAIYVKINNIYIYMSRYQTNYYFGDQKKNTYSIYLLYI